MTKISALFAAIVVVTILACSSAFAIIAAYPELERDAALADVICVGTVRQIVYEDQKSEGLSNVTASLHIERVLKGEISAGSDIIINYKDQAMINIRQCFSGCDLVLLRKDNGGYTFSKNALSSFPVSKEARSVYIKSENVDTNLRWEMINSVQDSSYQIVRRALDQSYLFSKDDIATYIRPLMSSPDIRISIEALATCLAAGDSSLLPQAVQLVIKQISDDQRYTPPAAKLRDVVMEEIVIGPDQVLFFTDAMTSDLPEVRKFACYVLRRSKQPTALPYLKAALDDSDSEVRYHAMMGLALITGDYEHTTTVDLFSENESYYLDYWKNK